MTIPSPTELQQLAVIDPAIDKMLKSGEFVMEVDWSDSPKAITRMRSMVDSMPQPAPTPEVIDSEAAYTTRDGTSLKLLIFSPASATDTLPVLVWYHGGGGVIGKPEATAPFCRTTAHEQNCVVISVQYRLGPEHRFPIGINDCWDALQHIAQHASQYGADPKRGFVVGGESNGGVNAAIVQLLARDEKLNPPLTGAYLAAASFYPPHNVPEKYKSSYVSRFDPTCLASPLLSAEAKALFDAAMGGDYDSPMYRATLWPTGHKNLPKTYFQTCGLDINRDDSFIYQDLLGENGVQTRLDVYPGCPHCFWGLFGMTAQGMKWKEDTRKGITWLFE